MIKTLLSLILLHKSAHINPFAIPYNSIYDHFASIQPQHRIGGIRLQGITGTYTNPFSFGDCLQIQFIQINRL